MGRIWLDVTRFLSVSRKTGVQRIVQNVLDEGWGQRLGAVTFSPEKNTFLILTGKPSIRQRRRASRASQFIWRGVQWAWRNSSRLRRRLPVRDKIDSLARRMYVRIFGKQEVQTIIGTELRGAPGSLLLLDIPRDEDHLSYLERCVDSGTDLVVYLYDLMPVQRGEIWSGEIHPTQVDFFSRFLRLVSRAKKVFCMSSATLRQYLCWAELMQEPQALEVLYPPVPDFSAEIAALQDGLPIPDYGDSLRVLAVAPFIRRKNLRVLLAAIELLAEESDRSVQLVLISPISAEVDPAVQTSLRRLSRKNSVSIVVLREVSDLELVSRYREAEVVAVPSLYEGFGLPLVEAAVLGCPIVASDIPVFREISGYIDVSLVDPHSPDAWAAKLKTARSARRGEPASTSFPTRSEFLEALINAYATRDAKTNR